MKKTKIRLTWELPLDILDAMLKFFVSEKEAFVIVLFVATHVNVMVLKIKIEVWDTTATRQLIPFHIQ